MKPMLLIVICLSYEVSHVMSHSSGAPASACQTLTPQHDVNVPQNSTPPYSIIVNGTSVNGTQPLQITLRADQGKSFKGFILQARKVESEELLGAFSFPDTRDNLPSNIRYMDCDDGPQASVTHKDNKPKKELLLQWESSGYYDGDVVFIGTFVEEYNTFWKGVKSQEVRVTKSKDFPSTSSEDPTTVATSSVATTTAASGTTNHVHCHGLQLLLFALTILLLSNQCNIF